MPPLKKCLDCGVLTAGTTRCPAHTTAKNVARGSAASRGYDSRWRAMAELLKKIQPWCSRCGTGATPGNPLTVDHIVPRSRGGSSARSNLMILCRACNSSKRDR